MVTYIAFLRGINSGLNPTLKMDVLKKVFEELDFQSVKTVIASGNVIFDTEAMDESDLEQTIEKALPRGIGFESTTIVYKLADLKRLFKLNPFKGIKIPPSTRPFFTFLKKPPRASQRLSGNGFEIIKRAAARSLAY